MKLICVLYTSLKKKMENLMKIFHVRTTLGFLNNFKAYDHRTTIGET